jgi:putative transcriptional regulator
MPTVRFVPDPENPPRFEAEELARLDALSAEAIEAAALSDLENPPLTEAELDRMASAQLVRRVRRSTGLSQPAFAARFRINPARVRDLERGRTTADSALAAYLKVIVAAPDVVIAALET